MKKVKLNGPLIAGVVAVASVVAYQEAIRVAKVIRQQSDGLAWHRVEQYKYHYDWHHAHKCSVHLLLLSVAIC